MRTLQTSSLLLLTALAACGTRATGTVAADSAAVMTAYEQYRQAWLAHDTAAALGKISNDIRIFISGAPDIVGMDATRKLFLDEMAAYRHLGLTLAHRDVIVRGDYATVVGTYDEVAEPTKGGAAVHNRGRYMTIWHKEGGDWRIVRYMLNDLPAR